MKRVTKKRKGRVLVTTQRETPHGPVRPDAPPEGRSKPEYAE